MRIQPLDTMSRAAATSRKAAQPAGDTMRAQEGSRRSARQATMQLTTKEQSQKPGVSEHTSDSELSDAPESEAEGEDKDGEGEGASRSDTEGDTEDADEDTSGDFGGGSRKRKRASPKQNTTKGSAAKAKKGPTPRGGGSSRSQPKARGKRTAAAGPHNSKIELNIKDDNALFNAVLDSQSAVQSNVEDWMILFQAERGEALSQLVNFFLRACGCNESVDEDQAQDLDGILDTLEDVQEIFKRESLGSYPIISRTPKFRKFVKSLSDFLGRLYRSAAEADLFDDDEFLPSIVAWVSALSSSTLRSFRHTATFIALSSTTHMNLIVQDLRREHSLAVRQRDLEKKKARQDKGRIRELESRVINAEEDSIVVERFLEDMISSVFVHRYRDSDPNIRADCVHELGLWMRDYPDKYLRGAYFRYLGWLLSDQDAKARLTSINAMFSLYEKGNFRSSVRHFTDLFKPRLLEMATSDVDVDVRCATLQLAASMHEHGIFEEEDLDVLALQIFSADAKVRLAAAPFVASMISKRVDVIKEDIRDSRSSKSSDASMSDSSARALFKSLALVLTKGSAEEPSVKLDGAASRVSIAIDGLRQEIPELANWRSLLAFLLSEEARDGAGGEEEDDSQNHPHTLSLDRSQEAALLEVIHVLLRKDMEGLEGSTEVAENVGLNLSSLLHAIPQLLVRHRTDAPLIARTLGLVPLLSPAALQDAGNADEREKLWRELHDHFMRHTESEILTLAIRGLAHLAKAEGEASGHLDRLVSVGEKIVQALRQGSDDRDLETAALSENDVHHYEATLKRLLVFLNMHEPQLPFGIAVGGEATTSWEIVQSLANRGRLGYSEESQMVGNALKSLTLGVFWLPKQLESAVRGISIVDPETVSRHLRLLKEYLGNELSIVTSQVRRDAFDQVITLLLLRESLPRDASATENGLSSTSGSLADAFQTSFLGGSFEDSLAQVLKASIDTVVEAPEEGAEEPMRKSQLALSDDESDLSDEELAATKRPSLIKQATITTATRSHRTNVAHEACTAFSSLIRLAQFNVIELKHLSFAMAQYGKVSTTFDQLIKSAADVIRQRLSSRRTVNSACEVIKSSMLTIHDTYIEGAQTASACAAMAKMFGNALVIRGPHLSILSAVTGSPLVKLHTELASHYIGRLEAIASSNDKRQLSKTLLIFKSLSSMLTSAKPKDAIAIKLSINAALQITDTDSTLTSKQNDLLQTYEKRLLAVASKHSGLAQLDVEEANGADAAATADPDPRSNTSPAQNEVEDAEEAMKQNTKHPASPDSSRKRARAADDNQRDPEQLNEAERTHESSVIDFERETGTLGKSPTPLAAVRPLPEPLDESHHILPSENPRKRTRKA
ncbi:hypothetical protein K437DRAFT_294942 [Tilletiaria anomala UBC 951]|uniref:SCD domain-containing protein n=1 Tax=Tilletiaria anomala (strain ATCC 24038 / CBS 436.72 / UBC 951) TaxID=1037660 RepID=A0A066VV20_TILAU|nr:uncharacterized protein K437DRAFT_294942 [Tilletiaria anomala UBC 951]KDN44143.1 hypothetical protein K437DRAFT_294942 [Tilletiaria anomala UBC 951]